MSDQIIDVKFTVYGKVQLDLARAEEDPWWETCARGKDLNDPRDFEQVVHNYVSIYLRNEQLLSSNAPWTCGPSSIYGVEIKINEKASASLLTDK